MHTKTRKKISTLLALVMVFSLFAAFPITASAATGRAYINVSTLGIYDANNKDKKSTESQWEYSSSDRNLILKTKNGNYQITGTNNDLNIKINADDIYLVLDNVHISYYTNWFYGFEVWRNCMINPMGTNVLNLSFMVDANKELKINGRGSLEINSPGYGFQIRKNSKLTFNSSVVVNASTEGIINTAHDGGTNVISILGSSLVINSNNSGIYTTGELKISCDPRTTENMGTLTVNSSGLFGIHGLKSVDIIGFTSANPLYTEGAQGGIYAGGFVYLRNNTFVEAKGNSSTRAVVTNSAIQMGNGSELTMHNLPNSPVQHTVNALTSSNASRWKLENATVTGGSTSLTSQSLNISIPASTTATISRVPNTLNWETYNGQYHIPTPVVGTAISPINVSSSVIGGNPPYTYSVEPGLLNQFPAGITINSSTGIVSGTPTTARNYMTLVFLRVTDARGDTRNAILYIDPVSGPLSFTNNQAYNIPSSVVGSPISSISVAGGVVGGVPPYTFAENPSSVNRFPEGITISQFGIISGTPTAVTPPGSARIRVTDSTGAAINFFIGFGNVISNVTALSFSNSSWNSIPLSLVGRAISNIDVSGGASGGTPPYTFAEDPSFPFPDGIAISSAGIISGTPMTVTNASNARIVVTDSAGASVYGIIQYGDVIADESLKVESPTYGIYHVYIPPSMAGVPIDPIDLSELVSGGEPPYEYYSSFDADDRLWEYSGVSIDRMTGVISGVPQEPSAGGDTRIDVFDQSGGLFGHAEIYVYYDEVESAPSLNAESVSIPTSWVGETIEPIDVSLGVSGGVPPYYYRVDDFRTLPAGLSINSMTGIISGTLTMPESLGEALIHVGDRTMTEETIRVNYGAVQAVQPLQFDSYPLDQDIPAATVGMDIRDVETGGAYYSYADQVYDGARPYSFTAAGLPDGLFMDSDGVIHGTFASVQVAGTATVIVTDFIGNNKSVTINYGDVSAASPVLILEHDPTFNIPASTVGFSITPIDISVGASGGTAPYTFDAIGLPSGLSISTAGVISGIPVEEDDDGTVFITVTDDVGDTATMSINYGAISVAGTPLSFTHRVEFDIPNSTVGSAINSINTALGVAGGTAPYTFSAVNLPAGLGISAFGIISGTTTTVGDKGTATITVTDNTSATASIIITYGEVCAAGTPFSFKPSPTFDISSSIVDMPIDIINVATSVSGGVAPYTFSAIDLPDGLTITSAGVIFGVPMAAQPAGTATIFVTDSDLSSASIASITINFSAVTEPVVLTGTASIDNMYPQVGDVLTGSLVGGINAGILSYQWKADGVNVGSGNTYTVAASDFGKVITLEITSSIEIGTTSTATAVVGKLTPTAADLTYPTPMVGVYDGTPQDISVTGPAGIGTITVLYDGSSTAPTNAGTYAVTVDVADGAVYGAATGISLGNYTIAPLDISGVTITANFGTLTYDGAAQTPTPSGVMFDVSSVVATTDYTIGSWSNNTNVGINTASVTFTGVGNYTGTQVVNFTIDPSSIVLKADDFTIVIGETEPTYSFSVVSGLVSPDTEAIIDTLPTYNLTPSFDNTATGTSLITLSGMATSNTNYTFGTAMTGTLTVTDKTPVTISGITVAGKVYDGVAVSPSGTETVTGSQGDHLPLVYVYRDLSDNSTSSAAPVNASSYQLEISIDAADPNYAGSTVIIPFIIDKATITITADNKTATRGSAIPAFTYTVSGLVAGENLLITPTVDSLTADMNAVGTYPIVASGAVAPSGDNYDAIVYVNGILTVNRQSGGSYVGGGSGGTSNNTIIEEVEDEEIDDVILPPLTAPFNDVNENDWFAEAVDYVYSAGLMIGVDENRFSPSGTLTRGMIVTILYRLEGEPSVANLANPFIDVADDVWYTDAIKWGAANDIVLGYGDGRFGPNDSVTKEQLAALIYRTQLATKKLPPDILMDFQWSDWNAISQWARGAVNILTIQGVFRDIEGASFNPRQPATRAEVASILFRWLDSVQ
ncbi:MAG: putative Ig domain-containing protein [Oscillospiraceae bacterium]|nr:putative Ig domain-containing protein [Oscillospiraceae bacterium]